MNRLHLNCSKALIFLATIGFTYFNTFPLPAHAQIESRPTPLWEGVQKSASDIENDQKLVKEALEITQGDRVAAASAMVNLGWQLISKGDPNGAVLRFNQAWLVKPDLPDIYWGLAVATHIRGDETDKVTRWFDEAAKSIKDNPRFLADRGRVLEERELPRRARFWFETALAIDPSYVPAHIGMTRLAIAIKDGALEAKHRKLLEKLQPAAEPQDETPQVVVEKTE